MKISFNKKNMNLLVGLLTLMIILWIISYAIPSLFVQMFGTSLGKLILLGIVALASMNNIKLGVGLLAIFFILYRFAYMAREGLLTTEQLITNAKNGKVDDETVDFMVNNGYWKYNNGQLNIMNKDQLLKAKNNINTFLSKTRSIVEKTFAKNSLAYIDTRIKTLS